jgi:hypothetical protein
VDNAQAAALFPYKLVSVSTKVLYPLPNWPGAHDTSRETDVLRSVIFFPEPSMPLGYHISLDACTFNSSALQNTYALTNGIGRSGVVHCVISTSRVK